MFIQDSTSQRTETLTDQSLQPQVSDETIADTMTVQNVADVPKPVVAVRKKEVVISKESIVYVGAKPEARFESPQALVQEPYQPFYYSGFHDSLKLQIPALQIDDSSIDESVYADAAPAVDPSPYIHLETVQDIPPPLIEAPAEDFVSPLKVPKPSAQYVHFKSFSKLEAEKKEAQLQKHIKPQEVSAMARSADSAGAAFVEKYKDSAINVQPVHIALQEPIDRDFVERVYKQVKVPLPTGLMPKEEVFYKKYAIERHEVPQVLDLMKPASLTADKRAEIPQTDERILNGQKLLPLQQETDFLSPLQVSVDMPDVGSVSELSVVLKLPATKELQAVHRKHQPKTITVAVKQEAQSEGNPTDYFSEAGWMLFFILGSLAVWGHLKILYSKYLTATVRSALSINQTSRLARERNDLASRVSFFLKLIFHANIGLFIFQAMMVFKPELAPAAGLLGALIISGITVLIYVGKRLLLNLLGFITKSMNVTSEYNHATSTYNKFLGLVLFPIIFSIPYLTKTDFLGYNELIYIGICAVGLAYFARLVRGTLITLQQNISPFYIILYLCMVEILPLLLLIKVLFI